MPTKVRVIRYEIVIVDLRKCNEEVFSFGDYKQAMDYLDIYKSSYTDRLITLRAVLEETAI